MGNCISIIYMFQSLQKEPERYQAVYDDDFDLSPIYKGDEYFDEELR